MREQKTVKARRPARILLVAAAMVAALAVTVSAAQSEAVQELFYNIRVAVEVGEFQQDPTIEDGALMSVMTLPEVSLEERDGRNVLTVDGEEMDITDALNQDGSYRYTRTAAEIEVVVDVIGAPGHWDYTATIAVPGEDGTAYSFSSKGDGKLPAEAGDQGGSIAADSVETNP